jgi:myo-inositol-1(or 4)-monophosphatase
METNLKSTAIYAAQSAGKILLDHFGRITEMDIVKNYKRDFTTKADLEAERAIIKIIKKKTPTYNIITEEAGAMRHRSPFTWIIDPLDGTTNYSIGNPFFGVSIALVKGRTPIIAVVYAPILDWMFTAEINAGAKLNNQPIEVSTKTKLDQCLNVYCRGNDDKNMNRMNKLYTSLSLKSKDFSRMRAGAYELALVATGKLCSYINPGCKSHDVAAGALLVREAGGRVTDFAGKEWDIDSEDILASNGKIHSKMILEVKKSLAENIKPTILKSNQKHNAKRPSSKNQKKKKKTSNIMIKH